jgi:hypothetical protein
MHDIYFFDVIWLDVAWLNLLLFALYITTFFLFFCEDIINF